MMSTDAGKFGETAGTFLRCKVLSECKQAVMNKISKTDAKV